MSKLYDCIVIGGGYSGLVSAITLAQNNIDVLIIEQNELIGRKILSTGNGRCNFTNELMSVDYFYSNSPIDDFDFDFNDSIAFLNSLGVIEKNINGYYYPVTNQAKTIREAFEIKIKELGIKLRLNTKVMAVERQDCYIIHASDGDYNSKNLIIATGGIAAPSLGSTGEGYSFAKAFGINVTKLVPSLVGLKSQDDKLKTIAGVRTQGIVSIGSHKCEGEIQFNKDSISGYPVMCISRFASLESISTITVNFVPFFTAYELSSQLHNRIENGSNKKICDLLVGILNDKCIDLIIKETKLSANSLASDLNEKAIKKLITNLTSMEFTISATKGYETAQVTAGGIDMSELNHNSLMVKDMALEGLYFIGEICDIDGICGGYNLEWARHSAFLAANDIVNRLGKE